MLEGVSVIANEILSFLVTIAFIMGVVGGLAFWVDKGLKRREILARMEKEQLKQDVK